MLNNNGYDIIIIGSGMGSLTLAGIMSKYAGKRVLLLERHFKPGGYTHCFSRGKDFKWDIGLHYVGKMRKGMMRRNIMDYISNNKLNWHKIDDPFECFIYPDFQFNVTSSREKYQNDLVTMFPEDCKSIKKYFCDIKKICNSYVLYYIARILPVFIAAPLKRIYLLINATAMQTVSEYLEKNITNVKLRSLLASQWGNYGLPPSQASFLIHSLVVDHFLEGGYYPDGGAEQIPKTILEEIGKKGSTCLTNHEVTDIIIKDNKVAGVRVLEKKGSTTNEKEFYAPVVVSGIGAYNTYMKLLPEKTAVKIKKKLSCMTSNITSVSLFIGLKESASALGVGGANFWIYDTYNHNDHHKNEFLIKGKPSACYLTFPSIRASNETTHTATIISFVNRDAFNKWENQSWNKRESDYYTFKDTITEGLIALVEKSFPGFRDMIVFKELSSPLTTEHFTDHKNGAMYGLAATAMRYKQDWLGVKTPVKNLYLTGTDITAVGIVSAMMSGLATASVLNGPFGFFKLMRSIKKYNKSTNS